MKYFALNLFTLIFEILLQTLAASGQQREKLASGIWKLSLGTPDKHRPTNVKYPAAAEALENLPAGRAIPAQLEKKTFKKMSQGVLAGLEMDDSERIYGFGLQVNTFG